MHICEYPCTCVFCLSGVFVCVHVCVARVFLCAVLCAVCVWVCMVGLAQGHPARQESGLSLAQITGLFKKPRPSSQMPADLLPDGPGDAFEQAGVVVSSTQGL